MYRYLALIWNPEDSESIRQVTCAEAKAHARPGWEVALRATGLLVVHRNAPPGATYLLNDFNGIVLGSIYHRTRHDNCQPQPVRFDAWETQRIIHSEGRHLVEHYWGSYVAILHRHDARAVSVLRDPTANLACFRAKWNRIDVFFSDAEDFTDWIPMPLSLDWRYMSARLIMGFQLSRECGLAEIEDIPGGELLTLSGKGETRSVLWHPSRFCVEGCIEDEEQAVQELRSTVLNVVDTLAFEHSDILVLLSGGLDSSIVTSCLAQRSRKATVTCLNFYITTDDAPDRLPDLPGLNKENMAKVRRIIGDADERQFASRVAQKCGFPLTEKKQTVRDIDIRRIQNALLTPRPSNYIFVLNQDDVESECAAACRATACFTGIGGDTVFCCTLRAIGAPDYAYLHPFGSLLLRHLAATATLSGESYLRVLGKVFKYGILRRRRPPPFDAMQQPHLLSDQVANAVDLASFHHPWIDGATGLCPGKHDQVAGVANSVPFYSQIHRRERIAPAVSPLASQPVVETCLRIPTYVLLSNGVSRGLARQAFRDLLPSEVARRTTKGGALWFWQRLVRENIQFIREYLLDGTLVRTGLLDQHKLEQFLIPEQPFLTVQPYQIMDYLGCEAWASQWNG